jgi:alkylhydroperoxidase/carboxymuconolactone decarboxylase family protein YurZ
MCSLASRAVLALIAATALTGCSDPYATAPRETNDSPSSPPTENRLSGPSSGELPGRIPARDRARLNSPKRPGTRTPDAAVRAYASAATNWTATTLPEQQRELAELAVGQARQDAEQLAATATHDPQLTDATTRSTGAVAGLMAGGDGWTLVVVRERLTIGAGAPPDVRYRIYRAHTTPTNDGVAVDQWEPEP